MGKLKHFCEYFKYLKNPISALAFKFGLKKNCVVKFKNTTDEINLTSIDVLNHVMGVLPSVKSDKWDGFIKYVTGIAKDNEFVVVDDIKYYNTRNSSFKKEHDYYYATHIHEHFTDDDWDMVNFKDRHVIDIGANVADSALYFAKNGANVIGFEPVKHIYELGIDNIAINPKLKNNIVFVNKGVGGKRGEISIENNRSTRGYMDQNATYDIEVITINDVLNDYNFTPDILKMDCEGCEFEIILNEDLSMFNDIIFEHHSEIVGKDYNLLIEKLKQENFKINTQLTNSVGESFDKIGLIHAYK